MLLVLCHYLQCSIIQCNLLANFNKLLIAFKQCLSYIIYGSLWGDMLKWQMGFLKNISLIEVKRPSCEFIVCFQQKFTMSDNNPRRQELHQFPALWLQKAVPANSRHASTTLVLELFARAIKNGKQKCLQLYCLG